MEYMRNRLHQQAHAGHSIHFGALDCRRAHLLRSNGNMFSTCFDRCLPRSCFVFCVPFENHVLSDGSMRSCGHLTFFPDIYVCIYIFIHIRHIHIHIHIHTYIYILHRYIQCVHRSGTQFISNCIRHARVYEFVTGIVCQAFWCAKASTVGAPFRGAPWRSSRGPLCEWPWCHH